MSNILKNTFRKLNDWWFKGKFTTNEQAANIIRRLVDNNFNYPLEWDDFESLEENNPEADIALELCIFFAKKFPGNMTALYCNEKALPYFLKIADMLEKNCFQDIDPEETRKSLRNGEIPGNLRQKLNIKTSDCT